MIQIENLVKGQMLRIDFRRVRDRISKNLLQQIIAEPIGKWMGGYKMVDGNQFALILEFKNGSRSWFFTDELNLIE